LLRSPLLHFLVLGALLFVAESIWSSVPETPVVEVRQSAIDERVEAYGTQMGRAPTPEERAAITRQVIDEAIWLEDAFALGLHEMDGVVHQRLALNMRFLEGEASADSSTDAELVARAFELGMERSDAVVQRRLVDRVQAIVRGEVRARPVEESVIEAHYAATAERWREPALLDLTHVYLSRDKRGDAVAQDAIALQAEIETAGVDPEAAVALGDPFLAGHRLRGASPTRISARLGPDFAAGVEAAPTETWVGPIESAFGQHVVWIHARQPSRIPELSAIRKRVVEDWIEIETRKALQAQIERRREVVEVRILADEA
jgi:hypothetical protein